MFWIFFVVVSIKFSLDKQPGSRSEKQSEGRVLKQAKQDKARGARYAEEEGVGLLSPCGGTASPSHSRGLALGGVAPARSLTEANLCASIAPVMLLYL